MTSTVTEVARALIQSHIYATISTTMGIIPIVLLIILLIQKEIMRAYGGRRTGAGARMINSALVPLMLVSALVIGLRVVKLVLNG